MTTENKMYNQYVNAYTGSSWDDVVGISDIGSTWYGYGKVECKPENQYVRNSDGSVKQNVSLNDFSLTKQEVPTVSQLAQAELPNHTHENVSSFEGIHDTTLVDQKYGLSWGWTRTWGTDKSYTTGFNINDVDSNLDINATGNTTNWYTTVNNPQAFNDTITICGVEITRKTFHDVLYEVVDMNYIYENVLNKIQELSIPYDYDVSVSYTNGFKKQSLTNEIEETLLSMIQDGIGHTHTKGTYVSELPKEQSNHMDQEDPFA